MSPMRKPIRQADTKSQSCLHRCVLPRFSEELLRELSRREDVGEPGFVFGSATTM